MSVVCVLVGGSIYRLQANDKVWAFEMHPYMGPCTVDVKTREPHPPTRATKWFWDAFERWQLGGNKIVVGSVRDEWCDLPAWCKACKGTGDNTEHIGGRHYKYIGPCEVCAGKKIVWNKVVEER